MSAMSKVLEVAGVLEKSPRLAAFCADKGFDSLRVVYPADVMNPEGEQEAPWIVLNPESGSGGQDTEKTTSVIGLDVGITEEDARIGSHVADEFFKLVMDVLVRSNINLSFVDYDFEVTERAPLRIVYSDVYFKNSRPTGRGNII